MTVFKRNKVTIYKDSYFVNSVFNIIMYNTRTNTTPENTMYEHTVSLSSFLSNLFNIMFILRVNDKATVLTYSSLLG